MTVLLHQQENTFRLECMKSCTVTLNVQSYRLRQVQTFEKRSPADTFITYFQVVLPPFSML